MKTIETEMAAAPLGHYAQGIVDKNGMLHTSVLLGIARELGPEVVGTIEEQAQRGLANLTAILEAGDSSIDKVVQLSIWVADINDWDTVNAVVAEVFGTHKPTRGVIPVNTFHKGFGVAFQALAET